MEDIFLGGALSLLAFFVLLPFRCFVFHPLYKATTPLNEMSFPREFVSPFLSTQEETHTTQLEIDLKQAACNSIGDMRKRPGSC